MTKPGTSNVHDYGDFARGLHAAFGEARVQNPQGVPGVEERLRAKLPTTRGITLAPDILRALAYALVNDRGADALRNNDDDVKVAVDRLDL